VSARSAPEFALPQRRLTDIVAPMARFFALLDDRRAAALGLLALALLRPARS